MGLSPSRLLSPKNRILAACKREPWYVGIAMKYTQVFQSSRLLHLYVDWPVRLVDVAAAAPSHVRGSAMLKPVQRQAVPSLVISAAAARSLRTLGALQR